MPVYQVQDYYIHMDFDELSYVKSEKIRGLLEDDIGFTLTDYELTTDNFDSEEEAKGFHVKIVNILENNDP